MMPNMFNMGYQQEFQTTTPLINIFNIKRCESQTNCHSAATARLTPSTPAVPNCCCLKASVSYWF